MPRNLNFKATICSVLGATLLLSLSVPVGAHESTEVPRRVVNFADLDLTHSAGVEALYVRIRSAAREVCEPLIARDLHAAMRSRTCAEQAIERAIAEANAPKLTSYYLAKTHRVVAIARRD
jgi:UrcA family protein